MSTETFARFLGKNYYTTLIGDMEFTAEYLSCDCEASVLINNIRYYDRTHVSQLIEDIPGGWRIPTIEDIFALNKVISLNNLPVKCILKQSFNKDSSDVFGMSLDRTGFINHDGVLFGYDTYSCFMLQHTTERLPWSNYAGMHRDSDKLDIYHCDIEAKLPVRLIRILE